jgi:threonine dehydratase
MRTVVTPTDIIAASQRITGRVRRTPVVHAHPLKQPITPANLYLKL